MVGAVAENYLGEDVGFFCEFGILEGTVRYGRKIPMKPGTTPLQEMNPNSDIREGAYWFTNRDQSVKVELLTGKVGADGTLRGKGFDVKGLNYEIILLDRFSTLEKIDHPSENEYIVRESGVEKGTRSTLANKETGRTIILREERK